MPDIFTLDLFLEEGSVSQFYYDLHITPTQSVIEGWNGTVKGLIALAEVWKRQNNKSFKPNKNEFQ